MADVITILKDPKLTPDEDYAFLRSEGLSYIEELSSKLWTDYNEHDPGITILEALCYAITELGYRSSLPMQDLLTGEDGKISSAQALFTAKRILTQAPLTVNDYRKLLIDINGVHNAWLFNDDFYTINNVITPAGEVPVFADCKKDELTYETIQQPVYLSGLYKVLLDLDDDVLVGNLNNGNIEILSPATIDFKAGDISFTVILPAWNDAGVNKDLFKANKDSLTDVTAGITQDGSNWKLSAGFSFTVTGDAATYIGSEEAKIIIGLKPAGQIIHLADMQAFFTPAFTQQLINLYIYKIQASKKNVQTAIKKLNENRNLCEDFVNVDTIKDEEIAICCDIDISPSTDIEEVQANVFYAIEEYLNPSVKFYLLKDLMDKGSTPDEIFQGPVLEHGFIDTGELEKTNLRQVIYASDIINMIMDIEGVLAVRNFRMTKYREDGTPDPAQKGKEWCLPITLWHKPLLSETKSKIIFYKNQFPYLPVPAEVRDTLRWLRAVNARDKLTGHADDFVLLNGQYMQLNEYTSLDNLFPLGYGIGKAGLPPSATEERRAQARQLKAYLLFYDQLLADFFSQLKNAKELFSTNTIINTYYGEFLDTIPDVDALYKKDGSSVPLLKTITNNHDSSATAVNDWQRLYETNETFIDRRNKFLDHLMARFAESFNDYVLLMYSLNYETQQETKIDPATMIDNKMQFLKTYPEVSYQRAKAFDYFPEITAPSPANYQLNTTQLWNTDNVSGLEKKAARLGGISDITRRYLFCFSLADVFLTNDSPAKYQFIFKNENGDTITSANTYEKESEAVAAITSFIELAKTVTNYTIEASGTNQHIVIKDDDGNNQGVSNDFADVPTATAARDKFIADFNASCNSEGLHLVEHILLRPRDNTFDLATVCLDPACDFCGEQDPYSFRMSVILPYWPNRFRNLSFRNYFEDIIRREAPAHTVVKICWLSNTSMLDFETAYKKWIEMLAGYHAGTVTINDFKTANNELTNKLFHLNSEYPVASLHDCDESEDTNPVMLGRTILGSFKKE